jgi:hypothetical protein
MPLVNAIVQSSETLLEVVTPFSHESLIESLTMTSSLRILSTVQTFGWFTDPPGFISKSQIVCIKNLFSFIFHFYSIWQLSPSTVCLLAMAHKILLIGGHGKVSQLLTPLLLARSWNVTSMIRSAEQKPTIEKLGQGQPGKLDILISSVEDVKSESDAQKILEQIKPDWVVWSAGMLHYLCSGNSPDSGHCHGSSLMNAFFT